MTRDDILKRNDKFETCPGSPNKEIYHGELKANGIIELVLDRIEDTDALIQSFEPSTRIDNIIKRIEAGEVDLLNQRAGFFIDSIGLPGTYAELLNTVIKGQQVFEKLPIEIKKEFDNDFNKWFAAMDSPDFAVRSGFARSADPAQSEVKSDES